VIVCAVWLSSRVTELRGLAAALHLQRLVWLCDRFMSPATAASAGDHPTSTFVANMSSLLATTTFADAKITVKHPPTEESKTFSLHRPLGHRYAYFRAMLSGSFLEATAAAGCAATVEDAIVTADVFADVLRWMYCGDMVCEPEACLSLLIAASRFMMSDLVSAAEARILAFVDCTNAKECMEFAAVHGFSRLEQMCRDFLGL
jgi:hypothetical protein